MTEAASSDPSAVPDPQATHPGRRSTTAEWSATCDTLHAHTQVLGKLAVALAPPEPQLQHAALRLTARGWETLPLPAPDRSGALVAGARSARARGVPRAQRRPRAARRARRRTARLARSRARSSARPVRSAGPLEIDPTPQEVSWTVPLDEDDEHATYDREAVARTSPPPPVPRSCSPRSGLHIGVARRRSTHGGVRSISR